MGAARESLQLAHSFCQSEVDIAVIDMTA